MNHFGGLVAFTRSGVPGCLDKDCAVRGQRISASCGMF